MTDLTPVLAAAGGAVSWSFAEYALHNWRGHLGRGRNEFSRLHLSHHADPDFFAPTSTKIRAALQATVALLPLASLCLGIVAGSLFVAGFLASYACYEFLHRRCHTHPPTGPFGRWARKHHFHHHFKNPGANHGVTSPLWDLVFRTHEAPGVVRVPRRQAMAWLVDPATGEVRPEFAADYVLAGRPASAARAACPDGARA